MRKWSKNPFQLALINVRPTINNYFSVCSLSALKYSSVPLQRERVKIGRTFQAVVKLSMIDSM